MRPDALRVLITGGGSGIGRALAIEASRAGAEVAICGRRTDALEETASLMDAPSEVLAIQADLTIPSDRAYVIDTVAHHWGSLDILINNAGVVEGGAHETIDDATTERMFATNVLAPMALTRNAFPLLMASTGRERRVVNIGSVFGDIAYPEFAAYSASKFALRGFSSALSREWRAHGIDVTYAAPRATRTDAAAAFSGLIEKGGMSLDAPEAVAHRIWSAIRAGRRRVYPAGPERFFILLQSLAPSLVDRALSVKPAKTAAASPSAISTQGSRS